LAVRGGRVRRRAGAGRRALRRGSAGARATGRASEIEREGRALKKPLEGEDGLFTSNTSVLLST